MEKTSDTGKGFSVIGNNTPRGLVWDDTRAFLAVARCGTLSAAALELNLGIATLSRRIERLETALKQMCIRDSDVIEQLPDRVHENSRGQAEPATGLMPTAPR